MVVKEYPLYGKIEFKIDVKEEDKCINCIHGQTCKMDMESFCLNYNLGTSEGTNCNGCIHRFTRYYTKDEERIPCFKCRLYLRKSLTLNELIEKCGKGANEKGWFVKWDGKAREAFPTFIALTAHELLNGVDKGWRDNNKDLAFEEIGDCVIRICHIASDLKIPLEEILERLIKENKERPYLHGRKKL